MLLLRCAPVALLLASCTTRRVEQLGSPVYGADRQVTISQTNDFLNMLSRGECGAIYVQASSRFHSRLLSYWLEQCEEFRKLIGPSMGFTAKSVVTCGTKIICVFGTGNTAHSIDVGWAWENNRRRLDYFSIGDGNERHAFPPLPQRPHFVDPPPHFRNPQHLNS
jgi:hypothetical protein